MSDPSSVLDFFTQVGSEPSTWLGQVAAALFAAMALHIAIKKTIHHQLQQQVTQNNPWKHALLQAMTTPLLSGIWIVGGLVIIHIVNLKTGYPSLKILGKIEDVGFILLGTWYLNRFISFAETNLGNPQFSANTLDKATLIVSSQILRVLVLVMAGLILVDSLGYSITGILALGGIGGLAIGFAAKDLLANFFGGIMIFLDRPFTIGDWIRSPDRQIEGVVEKIGWRSTCVMNFDQRPLYIPNAIFSQIIVENPSRMLNRRITETIGIRYQDLAKVVPIVLDIKKMLLGHPEIDKRQQLIVNFNRFSDSSLDILIDTYTLKINLAEFQQVKQDILLEISTVIEKHGAEISFPTTTVYLPSIQPSQKNK